MLQTHLAIAFTTSVCLFITITAAVPRPVLAATRASKSIITSSQTLNNYEKMGFVIRYLQFLFDLQSYGGGFYLKLVSILV